jgi:hypothetical protein
VVGVSKKLKNRLNQENRKKIIKKTNRKKNPIKPIKILKKPAGSVRFRFYKQKTEKNELNPNRKLKNRKKPSQNRKNQAKPV